ncbi:MAG: NUDIX domain-containing protein [Thaumarchaeota archaeon]|nr:NUDIX domain-containing protein [Nitrososphaerota archaeon]
MKFCPECRGELTRKVVEGKERVACSNCDFVVWGNPVPVAAAIIEYDGGIVLVRPRAKPAVWALPAGYVEDGENAEQAAVREVKEETNLDVKINRVVGTYSIKRPSKALIYIALSAETVGGALKAGDDALEASTFPIYQAVEKVKETTSGKALKSYLTFHRLEVQKI